MAAPNFFVVGAAKSGTTTLYHALRAHPDVYLPAIKEPHLYAYLADPPRSAHLYSDEAHARRFYAELYAGVAGERAIGDASTTNLVVAGVPEIIARDVPDARIVAVLRHPVDRAFSHFGHFKAAGAEELGFLEAIRTEDARQAAGMPFTYQYMGWSRYTVRLRPFIERFGRERVLVHLYDDLSADPAAVARRTLRFLDVDDGVPVLAGVRHNDVRLLGPGGRRVRGVRGLLRRTRRHPRLDPAIRAELTRELAAEIDALEDLLGRDLAAWRA